MLSEMRLFLYFVFIISGAESLNVPMCNTEMKMGAAFVKDMYAKHPNPIMYDGQQYGKDGCYDFFRGRDFYNYLNDAEKGGCITASGIAELMPSPGKDIAKLIANGICKSAIDRQTINCRKTYTDIYNQANFLNFQFQPWDEDYGSAPIEYPATLDKAGYPRGVFELHAHQGPAQSHAYKPFNQGKGTLWTELQIDWPVQSYMGPYGLNTDVLGSIFKFDQYGLLGFSKEVTFSASVSHQGIVILDNGVYGIYMAGCTPPVIYIRVTYQSSSETPNYVGRTKYAGKESPFKGKFILDTAVMVDVAIQDNSYGNTNSQGGYGNLIPFGRALLSESPTRRRLHQTSQSKCYKRVIEIYDIKPDSNTMACMAAPPLSKIESSLVSKTDTVDTIIIKLQEKLYAQSTTSDKYFIALSKGQAQVLVTCAQSSSYWKDFENSQENSKTTSQPGMCTPCKALASNTFTVPVSCSSKDCCYTCKTYPKKHICFNCDSDGFFVEGVSQCKPQCAKFEAFNNDINRQCTKCSLGKTIAFINTIAFIFSAFGG